MQNMPYSLATDGSALEVATSDFFSSDSVVSLMLANAATWNRVKQFTVKVFQTREEEERARKNAKRAINLNLL